MQSISSRKAKLHKQISSAIELKDEELLFFLESQHVHRYGLQSLNDYKQSIKNSLVQAPLQINTNVIDASQPKLADFPEDEICTSPFRNEIDIQEIMSISEDVSQASINCKKNVVADNPERTPKSDIAEKENFLEQESDDLVTPPPPTPSISHLRRWLPSIGNNIPKAS